MAEGVILDVTPGDARIDAEFLERLGHPVLVCHGPHERQLCPILKNSTCRLVEQAHGVIFQLDLDRPEHQTVLERYREVLAEDVPLRVVVKPGQEKRYADLLAGLEVWTHEPTLGEIDGFAAEVETADHLREE